MTPALVKSLSRLSRTSLIDLVLRWLDESLQHRPYLACNRTANESDEEDYLFTAAESDEELREIYKGFRQDEETPTKPHIIDRIVDGDWRRGLSLDQIATVDLAYLEQNDTALRWTALKLVPLDDSTSTPNDVENRPTKKRKVQHGPVADYPSISPSAFVAALKSEISPLVKAHYHLRRLPAPYDLPVVRLYVSPNATFAPRSNSLPRPPRHAVDTGRIMYIALPNSCPYVYISLSGSSAPPRGPATVAKRDKNGRIQTKVDMASLKRLILEAIPKAMSRSQERWALEQTKLTVKSLKSVCGLRGSGKPATSGGAYSQFVSESMTISSGPTSTVIESQRTADPHTDIDADTRLSQHQIITRFGMLEGPFHAALDRFHVTLNDTLRSPSSARSTTDAAPLHINFGGADVFAGLQKLAELRGGASAKQRHDRWKGSQGNVQLDMAKVPSWMTGETGMSSIVV